MARNGKYMDWITGEGLERICAWYRDGLTNEDVAHNIGITVQTLYEWLRKYPSLSSAVKITREVADLRVENALYKRARGYDYSEEVWERRTNRETGEPELVMVRRFDKHMPPDTTAQIFWLKNRRPAEWRDKREVIAEVEDGRETGVAIIAPVVEEATQDGSQ